MNWYLMAYGMQFSFSCVSFENLLRQRVVVLQKQSIFYSYQFVIKLLQTHSVTDTNRTDYLLGLSTASSFIFLLFSLLLFLVFFSLPSFIFLPLLILFFLLFLFRTLPFSELPVLLLLRLFLVLPFRLNLRDQRAHFRQLQLQLCLYSSHFVQK